ncbi:hypothetical protein [Cyanobium sp. Morenito 9A2]|uniref:hypothetical protein n=1 Tax=Cyanobium sp. Morenito 9A2 TaxID=2823718 RepID=UPI0020CF5E68|nr:hypothetical protein [Cyanobium sp. Morenito 9A2]MCP9851133.1 hypothetical protein [Cyanobium sp. Morenito 9A2]
MTSSRSLARRSKHSQVEIKATPEKNLQSELCEYILCTENPLRCLLAKSRIQKLREGCYRYESTGISIGGREFGSRIWIIKRSVRGPSLIINAVTRFARDQNEQSQPASARVLIRVKANQGGLDAVATIQIASKTMRGPLYRAVATLVAEALVLRLEERFKKKLYKDVVQWLAQSKGLVVQ